MSRNTRRGFLEDVGSGMLVAGLGASLANDIGIASAFAEEGAETLHFGKLRPLVGLLQDTPVERCHTARTWRSVLNCVAIVLCAHRVWLTSCPSTRSGLLEHT